MKSKNTKLDPKTEAYMTAFGASEEQKEKIRSEMHTYGFITLNDFLKIINNSSDDFASDKIGFEVL